MNNSLDLTSKLAIDSKNVDTLQFLAKKDSKKALHEAAKQFEAMFLHMLVKSMRDATIKSGLTNSQDMQFYTEMYDQQLAQTMSEKGIGLADIMVKQLTNTYHIPDQTETDIIGTEENVTQLNQATESLNHQATLTVNHSPDFSNQDKLHATPQQEITVARMVQVWPENNTLSETKLAPSGTSSEFINTLKPHANSAAEITGIPAHFMLAQAALESGWGKHEIRRPDNSPSHNLFGIKAGKNWTGETVETVTTEYINGVPRKMVEKFRAYNSYEEAFHDYAKLLSNNPRYADVVNTQNATEFAYGLQRAGYATDPKYADKLLRILNNSALSNRESI